MQAICIFVDCASPIQVQRQCSVQHEHSRSLGLPRIRRTTTEPTRPIPHRRRERPCDKDRLKCDESASQGLDETADGAEECLGVELDDVVVSGAAHKVWVAAQVRRAERMELRRMRDVNHVVIGAMHDEDRALHLARGQGHGSGHWLVDGVRAEGRSRTFGRRRWLGKISQHMKAYGGPQKPAFEQNGAGESTRNPLVRADMRKSPLNAGWRSVSHNDGPEPTLWPQMTSFSSGTPHLLLERMGAHETGMGRGKGWEICGR